MDRGRSAGARRPPQPARGIPRANKGVIMTTSTQQQPTVKATITKPSDREIRIERIFNAPRDRVWKAMTDPKLVAQWWGRGNKLVIEKFELERGGHWRFVEHGPEGVRGFEGRFREVTPPERIVQTFEWDGMPGHVIDRKSTRLDSSHLVI